MQTLNYGIEIETIHITRLAAATAIQSVVGGQIVRRGGTYDEHAVVAPDGRSWKVVSDSSLRAPREYQAEVVSPICTYEDIETIQKIVRALRKARAQVDESCGIHIHIDAARFTPAAVRNLVKTVHKQERLIEAALTISDSRKNQWCKSVDADFLQKIEADKNLCLTELNKHWYGFHNANPRHYDSSRYRGLNLHNIWYLGTVEYRWFESTLHAGKVKAYLQFALALSAKAIKAKSASSARREYNPATAKYDFRVFLLSLGMIGDEFKTARLHLLANLGGSAAWKGERRDTVATPEALAA